MPLLDVIAVSLFAFSLVVFAYYMVKILVSGLRKHK
jgi:hypothetical protein